MLAVFVRMKVILPRIPFARGLGSSSAAIVGGIVAGLVLAGHELGVWGAEELLQIVSASPTSTHRTSI
jgi:homoserine kinase